MSEQQAKDDAVRGVTGVVPTLKRRKNAFIWKVELGARRNYRRLGKRLAAANGHLYRNGLEGHGLVHVLSSGDQRLIMKATQLAPVIVDSLVMTVAKDGKVVTELPATTHLNAMLRSEAFLGEFRPVARVSRTAIYLEDFSIARPGYHDDIVGGPLLYVGPAPEIIDSTETISRFLDVMDFASNADRTNVVGAAITIMLRRRWPGQKPAIVITATKSHAGKGTITEFVRGGVAKADLLYESIDWPMQSQFQRQVCRDPDIGMVVLDNVRMDSAGGRARCIRSAFIESFVTNSEVTLASPGAGEAIRLKNEFVFAINTNDGSLSPDLMNRALPIHLAPTGSIQDRKSPIGNPKLEFLPQNRARIEAELRGMIERWRSSGKPLDEAVIHPMTPWARTVGGILKANGFSDFLANQDIRRTADDPIQEALSILAATHTEEQLRPGEWADVAEKEGLSKVLFATHERDTAKGRERATGVILSRHRGETFEAITETKRIRVRLDGGFRRWTKSKNPHMRYVFTKLTEEALQVED